MVYQTLNIFWQMLQQNRTRKTIHRDMVKKCHTILSADKRPVMTIHFVMYIQIPAAGNRQIPLTCHTDLSNCSNSGNRKTTCSERYHVKEAQLILMTSQVWASLNIAEINKILHVLKLSSNQQLPCYSKKVIFIFYHMLKWKLFEFTWK